MQKLDDMPDDVARFAHQLTRVARKKIERGDNLDPTWFLIDMDRERFMPVSFPCNSEAAAVIIPMLVRDIVASVEPDVVVSIAEAVIRKLDDNGKPLPDGQRDVLSIIVETYDGIWFADPDITTLESGRRLMDDVLLKFDRIEKHQGPMIGLLPTRDHTTH